MTRRRSKMETKTVEMAKYQGREGHGTFRQMSNSEVLALRPGQEIWFRSRQGDARRARVNGKLKTWKRKPGQFELPLKYGLYEYCRLGNSDLPMLLVEVEGK
jgi:hypothetical protein